MLIPRRFALLSLTADRLIELSGMLVKNVESARKRGRQREIKKTNRRFAFHFIIISLSKFNPHKNEK